MNEKEMIETFEYELAIGKLKAYSEVSLKRPLTDEEHKAMMKLKEEIQ